MPKKFEYDSNIYRTIDASIVLEILRRDFQFNSVLDIGCGLGSWLRVLEDNFGVTDYIGVDASAFDAVFFHIEKKRYLQRDLQQPLNLNRRFDLVMCLEVAEHLPEEAAHTIIQTLVAHSDVILFSAAIPGQGGQMHINEQWQSWWQRLFMRYDFLAYDLIRPILWEHPTVHPWYKQNILLYVKNGHPGFSNFQKVAILDLVNPGIFNMKMDELNQLLMLRQKEVLHPDFVTGLKIFAKAILHSLKLR